jgi:hypothetical protein
MAEMGQIRPQCSIGWDGSLSSDSCRARRVLLTAESGQRTNPLARESAARGAEQVARVALAN